MEEQVNYCTACGGPLSAQAADGKRRLYCPACGRVVYLNPKLVAAALVRGAGGILLVQRNMDPGKGRWAIPAGYVDRGEVVEAAVRREVLEETGLLVEVVDLVGLYSEEGSPIVMAAFSADVLGGEVSDSSSEVQGVGFFPVESLPPMAFPRDERVIRAWLHREG